jgi:hypothetical protein
MHLRRSALVVVLLCTAALAGTAQSRAVHARGKLLPITTSSPAAR